MSQEEIPTNASMGNEWAVGALKPKSIDNKPPEFLTQLAKDIAMNLVFTSFHVRENDISVCSSMIFLPIGFGAFANHTPEYVNDVGMIYEYYDKAGPRSINGYPIFFSCAYLNKHDTQIVMEKATKIQEMLENLE